MLNRTLHIHRPFLRRNLIPSDVYPIHIHALEGAAFGFIGIIALGLTVDAPYKLVVGMAMEAFPVFAICFFQRRKYSRQYHIERIREKMLGK